MRPPFYVTTPIYYVNDVPHLGTAYTTIAADVLARYKRLAGFDVRFLTGTDEHGEKIEQTAKSRNQTAKAVTDEMSEIFRESWKKMNISFDDFIRTTEKRHADVVQHLVGQALEKGDIYLGEYEGWYCVSDESFWTDGQLKEGKCPECGREVKKIKEENYFFKVAKYVPKLLSHIEANPDFILPIPKKNEVVAFLKEGVRDVSASRTSFTWGIPFPKGNSNPKQNHVIYVWFDALINYVSALDPIGNLAQFKKYWGSESDPHAIHLIGKDILRFHAVYWPCFLMSVGLPLPKRIFAHGWWTVEGAKMSKSRGNAIEPLSFTAQYGQDAFRLFIFREFPMGQDGDFSLKNFKERVNADLANNFGNLLNRTSTLIEKNMQGLIQPPSGADPEAAEIIKKFQTTYELMKTQLEVFNYHGVLNEIFSNLLALNKYIDTKAPWSLAKDSARRSEMEKVLNNIIEGVRIGALLLAPFIPMTSDEVLKRLGQQSIAETIQKSDFAERIKWGGGVRARIAQGTALFPRLM